MKKVFLALAMVAVYSGQASAVIVMQDNFDSYADQAAFQAAWPLVTANSGQLTTTPTPVSAPNSVSFDATGTQRNQRLFAETGVPSATDTIVFSFDFYDSNGATAANRQHYNLQDGTAPTLGGQLISMGLNNNHSNSDSGGNYYMARILGYNLTAPQVDPDGGPNEEGTLGNSPFFKLNDFPGQSVLRSTGWHNLKVEISPTTFSFYVDNILSERVANTLTLRSYDVVRIGSGLSSGAYTTNVDNVSVSTIPVPELGSFAAVTLASILSLVGVSTRRRQHRSA